jgi:hypothetical protein
LHFADSNQLHRTGGAASVCFGFGNAGTNFGKGHGALRDLRRVCLRAENTEGRKKKRAGLATRPAN